MDVLPCNHHIVPFLSDISIFLELPLKHPRKREVHKKITVIVGVTFSLSWREFSLKQKKKRAAASLHSGETNGKWSFRCRFGDEAELILRFQKCGIVWEKWKRPLPNSRALIIFWIHISYDNKLPKRTLSSFSSCFWSV